MTGPKPRRGEESRREPARKATFSVCMFTKLEDTAAKLNCALESFSGLRRRVEIKPRVSGRWSL
jgi:hypothetical protein